MLNPITITSMTGSRNAKKGNEDSASACILSTSPGLNTEANLKFAYESANQEIANANKNIAGLGSTCAAVSAWRTPDNKLMCITNHLGDSGISVHIMKKNGSIKNIQLTNDHVATNQSEIHRLENTKLIDEKGNIEINPQTKNAYTADAMLANGRLASKPDDNGNFKELMTTRGFGDAEMHYSGYLSQGEIKSHTIDFEEGDRIFISAWSDGIKEKNPDYLAMVGKSIQANPSNLAQSQIDAIMKAKAKSTDDCTLGIFEVNNTVQALSVFDGHGSTIMMSDKPFTPGAFSTGLASNFHQIMLRHLQEIDPEAQITMSSKVTNISVNVENVLSTIKSKMMGEKDLISDYTSHHKIAPDKNKIRFLNNHVQIPIRNILNNPKYNDQQKISEIIKILETSFSELTADKPKKNSALIKFGLHKNEAHYSSSSEKLNAEPKKHHATRAIGLMLQDLYQQLAKQNFPLNSNQVQQDVLKINNIYSAPTYKR